MKGTNKKDRTLEHGNALLNKNQVHIFVFVASDFHGNNDSTSKKVKTHLMQLMKKSPKLTATSNTYT